MTNSKKTTTSEKKSYHHGDLRQVLILAAAKIIREEGDNALSMRKLATHTGVSRTAPYHHFEDKQDLLCAVAEEGFSRFDDFLAKQALNTNLQEHLQNHLKEYVNFAVENSEYYDLMFSSQIWKSQRISASLKEKAYDSFKHYADNISELCDKLDLPDGVDPLRIAQLSWSTFHGLSRMIIDGIYLEKQPLKKCSILQQYYCYQLLRKINNPLLMGFSF